MYDCRTPSSAHGAVARLLAATMPALAWIVPGSASEPYARVVIAEAENRATVMQALVTDARGAILAESAPVQFHVQPGSLAPQARTGGR